MTARPPRDEPVIRTPESVIALATELILRSGVDQWCVNTFDRRTGPKRPINWLGFLVTVQVAKRHKIFRFDTLADVYLGFPRRVRDRFDVRDAASAQRMSPASEWKIVRAALTRMWEDLSFELDSSPITRPYPDLPVRRQIDRTRIDLCDQIAAAWLPRFPHDTHVEDGTAIDGHRNRRRCGDPHSRYGHRTPTDRDTREFVFGFLLCAIILGNADRAAAQPPNVVLHHELVPANTPEGLVALRLYRRHASTCALRRTVGDRHVSYTPADSSIQLLGLDAMAVHDLQDNLLGQRGMLLDFWVIDSWLWWPGLEPRYWKLPNTADNRPIGEWRAHFAAQLLSRPNIKHPDAVLVGCPGRAYPPDIAAQFICPRTRRSGWEVVGEAPEVGWCPKSQLCKASAGVWVDLLDDRGRPTRIGRALQAYPRLSADWYDEYTPQRNRMEGAYSLVTTPNGSNLGERAHLITGLPGTALWVAFGLALFNRDRVRSWLRNARVHDEADPDLLAVIRSDPLYASRAGLEAHYETLFPED